MQPLLSLTLPLSIRLQNKRNAAAAASAASLASILAGYEGRLASEAAKRSRLEAELEGVKVN